MVFFATVVVVDWGLVETFGATVLFDEAGLADTSVVVGPTLTTFLSIAGVVGAVVAVNKDVGVAF